MYQNAKHTSTRPDTITINLISFAKSPPPIFFRFPPAIASTSIAASRPKARACASAHCLGFQKRSTPTNLKELSQRENDAEAHEGPENQRKIVLHRSLTLQCSDRCKWA